MNLNKYLLGLMIIFSAIISSCKKACPDDPMPLKPTTYTGTFRTDGYYYHFVEDNEWDGPIYKTYIFYRNGIMHTISMSGFDQFEADFNTGWRQQSKYGWGAYFINDSAQHMVINNWRPSQCGQANTLTRCTVIDDTTFIAILSIDSRIENGKYTLNDTFHFRQHNTKPDSSNKYIWPR
ncbi:MAG: hypothetical protein KDC07_03825 [Chitinophagaceae bacterium]|nr:hypothetical protein [Chitinophagaceae bacterium]